jgi:hypothetical protein
MRWPGGGEGGGGGVGGGWYACVRMCVQQVFFTTAPHCVQGHARQDSVAPHKASEVSGQQMPSTRVPQPRKGCVVSQHTVSVGSRGAWTGEREKALAHGRTKTNLATKPARQPPLSNTDTHTHTSSDTVMQVTTKEPYSYRRPLLQSSGRQRPTAYILQNLTAAGRCLRPCMQPPVHSRALHRTGPLRHLAAVRGRCPATCVDESMHRSVCADVASIVVAGTTNSAPSVQRTLVGRACPHRTHSASTYTMTLALTGTEVTKTHPRNPAPPIPPPLAGPPLPPSPAP